MTRESAPTLLLRIAGLPVAEVERFSSGLCSRVEDLEALAEDLEDARSKLVEQLYVAIGGAAPERRAYLLGVKRDAFNGRPLERRQSDSDWRWVMESAASPANRVLDLERRVAATRDAFDMAYRRTLHRQRQALVEEVRSPGFVRGLAFASTVVARNRRRLLSTPPARFGRREKRLESTIARYLSRTALKLSPFSSLTTVALARLVPDGPAVRLLPGTWRERSLVRIKRYLLDQYLAMLSRHPSFRHRLRTTLNTSLAEVEPGQYLYLRPSYWKLNEDGDKLHYHRDALVKVRLGGPLVEYLRQELSQDTLKYHDLINKVVQRFGPEAKPAAIERQLDRLADAGFIELALPWSEEEGHVESRLWAEIRSLPPDPRLSEFTAGLQRLLELESGYPGAAEPAQVLEEIDELIERLWQKAAPLGGLSSGVDHGRASRYNIYQDVLRFLGETAEGGEIAEVNVEAAQAAVADVLPLTRLSVLFDPRQDFLLTLGRFATDRFGMRRVALLELFDAAQQLWQDYVRFVVNNRNLAQWPPIWNPMNLEEVAALGRRRREVWRALPGLLSEEGDGRVIDRQGLASLLSQEQSADEVWGACLFLQLASKDGSLWVLNRLKEGTGRFSSRYTPAMDERMRRSFTERLIERGAFELSGERVELLDLICPQGDTLNVHACQTPKVLVMPGAASDISSRRQLHLRDLEVQIHEGRLPTLRDRTGQRYLPVQLGVGYYDYLPTLIKFLSTFGPSELGAVFPPAAVVEAGGVQVRRRTWSGRVVIQRQAWIVSVKALRQEVLGRSDTETFCAITRWRKNHSIPERVFLTERVPHPVRNDRHQPQYIDFTSPIFVGLFRSAVESTEEHLSLAEMLPTPEMFPAAPDGKRWAVELLVDSLMLRPRTVAVLSAEPSLPRPVFSCSRTLGCEPSGHGDPPPYTKEPSGVPKKKEM